MKIRLLLLMVGLNLALPAMAQDATRGNALFAAQCSRCHGDGAAGLTTPLAELPAFLAAKSVRKHRFELSTAEVEDLSAYLATVRPVQ
jgi:mono/diheme cytochrome c family protein